MSSLINAEPLQHFSRQVIFSGSVTVQALKPNGLSSPEIEIQRYSNPLGLVQKCPFLMKHSYCLCVHLSGLSPDSGAPFSSRQTSR